VSFELDKSDGFQFNIELSHGITLNQEDSIAVVDTGTSMMAIPFKDYNILTQMWQTQINNKDEFVCQMGLCIGGQKCSHFEPILSNISLVIENELFEIMPKGYLLNGQDLDPDFIDTCIFGVMPLPSLVGSMKMYLLGDVFLRSFYSVFDFEQQSVKLGINIHAKEYASIRQRDPAYFNSVAFLIFMAFICLTLAYAYNYLTGQIKWVMIESLDEQKIDYERAYLNKLAMETNPSLYSYGNVYYNEKPTNPSRQNTINTRYKNIVSMSAIAEANEAIELSDEDEIGPPIRTVNKVNMMNVSNSKSNIYESHGNNYNDRSGNTSASIIEDKDEDDTL